MTGHTETSAMVKKRILSPIPLFDEKVLEFHLTQVGVKTSHIKKIWKHMIQNSAAEFDKIPNMPQSAYKLLNEKFITLSTRVVEKLVSVDGTIKLLVQLQDKHQVEAVIMRHKGRNTLCVSSQVGCQMGCTFCATGTMGIIGDLTSGEILEQLLHANLALAEEQGESLQVLSRRNSLVRNIVFMGMGEPLNNYDAVLLSIKGMMQSFNIAPKHITLSTVGVIHRMRQLKRDAPFVRLALSLHAPTQEMRCQIVPSAKAYPLSKLMDAMDEHLKDRNQSELVLIEYVMLHGVNDSLETAHLLGKLLYEKSVHVNLIPYNATEVDAQYQAPPIELTRAFHGVLRESYNLKATVRENHGMDIDGACGQLAVKKIVKPKRVENDIEDLVQKRPSKRQNTKEDISINLERIQKGCLIAVSCAFVSILLYKHFR